MKLPCLKYHNQVNKLPSFVKLSVAIELKDILVTNISCHHLKLTDWHEGRLNSKL